MPMTKPTSEQVTHISAGTGAVERNVIDRLRDCVSLKDFGAVGNNVADDTTALVNALAYCNANNRTLFIPAGRYKITSNVDAPASINGQFGFSIIGEGMEYGSVLDFTGASVTTGLRFMSPPPVYQYRGFFHNFMLLFSSGATGGMTISWSHHPFIDRITVANCGGTVNPSGTPGVTLDNCNGPRISNCLLSGTGSSTKGALYINRGIESAVDSNYIGGQVYAGIHIERGSAHLTGNLVESAGYLVLAGEESDSVYGVGVTCDSNNLENPTGSYIRIGKGVTGGAANGTYAILRDNTGSPSGSTSISHCIDIGSINSVTIEDNFMFGETVSTIALGSQNVRCRIPSQYGLYRAPSTVPYITIGGTHLKQASALGSLDLSYREHGLFHANQSISVTTSAIQNTLVSGSGGLYSRLYLSAASPITVNNTLNYPEVSLSNYSTGTELTIFATDGNVTLAHNAAGLGAFILLGGINLTLSVNCAYRFIWNGNVGKWSQI